MGLILFFIFTVFVERIVSAVFKLTKKNTVSTVFNFITIDNKTSTRFVNLKFEVEYFFYCEFILNLPNFSTKEGFQST